MREVDGRLLVSQINDLRGKQTDSFIGLGQNIELVQSYLMGRLLYRIHEHPLCNEIASEEVGMLKVFTTLYNLNHMLSIHGSSIAGEYLDEAIEAGFAGIILCLEGEKL